ncbi:MAG: RagB/SusD family nutrient uptake outer membrane protein [Dysgonamonadaceae bacterium]|jgi:hypothetical protein|nr:RagB/SusD family nutrient uptake outer membrane protein [Dysgonamonadaceae bacterium]
MKKKIILYAGLFLLLFTGYSCSDFLDKAPDDQLTLEKVFNDKIRTEEWLAGVYTGIIGPFTQSEDTYDGFGDDFSKNSGIETWGAIEITKLRGNWTPSDACPPDYFGNLPRNIRAAHLFIANAKPLFDQGVPPEEVELMKAECRFLIAYYYYLMVKIYGAVPFQDGLADLETPVNELMLGQRPFHEMIDWIDNELKEAANVLPPYYSEAGKYGRATSIVCLAVRARMLLFAASPLVNDPSGSRSEYVSYENDKGEKLFDFQYQPERWTRAAEACRELIELAHANGHALYYEYNSDGSIDPFMSYTNMSLTDFHNGNKEILFAKHSGDYAQYESYATPNGARGSGFMGVTQSLVDAFFMANGLPAILGYEADGKTPIINKASNYSEQGFSTNDELRKTQWLVGKGASKNNLMNPVTNAGTYMMYYGREPRFYCSVRYNEQWHQPANRNLNFFKGGNDNVSAWDSPENGYLLFKRLDPYFAPAINPLHKYRPGIIFRLGEAYLNYAEALNECDPGNPDILFYLNKIRERAGIPVYGTGADQIAVPANQAEMRKAIHRERRVELNCESTIRFDDIRRWKQVEELLSVDFYGMNAETGTEKSDNPNLEKAFYKRTQYFKRGFTWRNYWFPIPQSQMDKNPNLRQLPGWRGSNN